MKHSSRAPFLKNERQKTDDSLVAERDKTNESITKSGADTEQQTDRRVEGERRQADQTTVESRDEADFDSKDETKAGKDQLVNERDRADKAIELERARVDLAFERERELKSAMATQLLQEERKLTDKNLSAERTRTDSEFQRASGLLSDEISEHSKTKISLTTRDEFLAIVSHDLKNPIGAASLCAKMLLEDADFRNLGMEARQSVELIQRNVDTSLRLIADLLDMERIEGGKLQLTVAKHDIGEIMREVVEAFALGAHAKSIILRMQPPDISGDVFCDKDRIMQVLSNLIGNALKFTPKGGSINLSAAFGETEVQVSVCDSGAGIPAEKIPQIFERFAQLRVNDRVGLGLGLYISKMLIEAHRGRLWVNSTVGRGSTFNFTIPRSKNSNDVL